MALCVFPTAHVGTAILFPDWQHIEAAGQSDVLPKREADASGPQAVFVPSDNGAAVRLGRRRGGHGRSLFPIEPENVNRAVTSLSLRTANNQIGTAELTVRLKVADPVRITTMVAAEVIRPRPPKKPPRASSGRRSRSRSRCSAASCSAGRRPRT